MRKGLYLLALILISCGTKDPVPNPVVSDYLPLQTGSYQIYSVDSVVINQNVEVEYIYELKTEVTDSFPATGGGFTFILQRSKRTSPQAAWTSLESWSARVSTFQAVVNEGNIGFVKMAGPLENGKAWNGNAYNILGGSEKCFDGDSYSCDNYAISNLGKPYTTDSGKNFENALTVVQNDNEDLIVSLDKRSEVYAKNVGLVFREIKILNYCTDQNCLGTQFVEKGLRFRLSITEYGNE